MSADFKLLKTKPALTSRVFSVRHETWRAPDGSRFKRDTVVHPGAVAIVPVAADGNVLMIRQFRPAVKSWLLEIPAGTLEKNEKPLACAKRELIEEVGFSARRWRKLGEICPAPGFCSEIIHLYLAWDLKPAFAEKDEDEHIEVVRMSLSELKRAAKKRRIRDAKTLSALLYLELGDLKHRVK